MLFPTILVFVQCLFACLTAILYAVSLVERARIMAQRDALTHFLHDKGYVVDFQDERVVIMRDPERRR